MTQPLAVIGISQTLIVNELVVKLNKTELLVSRSEVPQLR